MCRTTDYSFRSSNTLNNTVVTSLIELASLYTVPLSTVNGLSRLTTTSNGQAWLIRKFSSRPMTFESNRNGRFESNRISKLRRSLEISLGGVRSRLFSPFLHYFPFSLLVLQFILSFPLSLLHAIQISKVYELIL